MECNIRVISDKDGNTYVASITDDGQVIPIKNVCVDSLQISEFGGSHWKMACSFIWRGSAPS